MRNDKKILQLGGFSYYCICISISTTPEDGSHAIRSAQRMSWYSPVMVSLYVIFGSNGPSLIPFGYTIWLIRIFHELAPGLDRTDDTIVDPVFIKRIFAFAHVPYWIRIHAFHSGEILGVKSRVSPDPTVRFSYSRGAGGRDASELTVWFDENVQEERRIAGTSSIYMSFIIMRKIYTHLIEKSYGCKSPL